MKIFQLIDLIIKLFKLNKRSKVVLLFLVPTFLLGQNNGAFWLGKRPSGAAPTNLLLDDYPGAAAAYSLRKLDKDYGGFAVEVRRSSDGNTQNIGFSNNDFDTASLNSFCSGTSCTVRTWYDQSGNGRDAVKSTAAQQAIIYQSGAIITENSKPALRPVAAPGYATNVSGLTDFCIIVIGNNSPGVSNSPLTRFVTSYEGAGIPQSNDVLNDYTGTQFRAFAGASPVSVTAPISIDFVSFVNKAGTSTNIDVNGGTYQNTANLTMTSSKALYLFEDKAGANFTETARGFNEFIIYNSSQLTNKSGLLNNINFYYSIY